MLTKCLILGLVLLTALEPSLATNFSVDPNYAYFGSTYVIIGCDNNKYIPGEAINFINISSNMYFLEMRGCELTKIPQKVFLDFKEMNSLDLSRNKIKQLSISSFKNAQNISSIKIQSNNITVLKNRIFVNCTELTNLDLSSNQIKMIAINAFLGLQKLEILYLSNNKLTTLNDNLFKYLTSITSLELEGNLFKKISSNLLKNNQRIEFLNIGFNVIETIEEGALSGFNHLVFLKLDGNLLTASPELPASGSFGAKLTSNALKALTVTDSMTKIFVEDNMISSINCSKNMSIVYMYASNNSLQSFGCIRNMTRLSSLYLDHNKITQLSKAMFVNLKDLYSLELSYNPIKKVTPTMFAPLIILRDLSIDKMSAAQNIREQMQGLQSISLTTTTWNCSALLSVAKTYNSQKINLLINTPPVGKKAACALESYEINVREKPIIRPR